MASPSDRFTIEQIEDAKSYVRAKLRARRARRRLRFRNETFQTTDLTHEVVQRLIGAGHTEWENEGHFLAIFSRKANFVLIDHIRKRAKTGTHTWDPSDLEQWLDDDSASSMLRDAPDRFVMVEQLIRKLEFCEEFGDRALRMVYVVRLRHDWGFRTQEIADALGVDGSTVRRDWNDARKWLAMQLRGKASQ